MVATAVKVGEAVKVVAKVLVAKVLVDLERLNHGSRKGGCDRGIGLSCSLILNELL